MKKIITVQFFVVFFLILLVLPLFVLSKPVFAQQATTEANTLQKLEKLRLNREELKNKERERVQNLIQKRQEVKERIGTREAEAKKKTVERIKTVFTKFLNRFNAALLRLDKISQRLATRIDKLKARGVNTQTAEAKLAQAEKLGAAAATAIDSAKAQIDSIDSSSSNVRDAVHAAREAVVSAKKALFEYHKALVNVIRELKASADLREGTDGAK